MSLDGTLRVSPPGHPERIHLVYCQGRPQCTYSIDHSALFYDSHSFSSSLSSMHILALPRPLASRSLLLPPISLYSNYSRIMATPWPNIGSPRSIFAITLPRTTRKSSLLPLPPLLNAIPTANSYSATSFNTPREFPQNTQNQPRTYTTPPLNRIPTHTTTSHIPIP